MASWHSGHSSMCFFQLLVPGLTNVSLLENDVLKFEIVTLFTDTGETSSFTSIVYGCSPCMAITYILLTPCLHQLVLCLSIIYWLCLWLLVGLTDVKFWIEVSSIVWSPLPGSHAGLLRCQTGEECGWYCLPRLQTKALMSLRSTSVYSVYRTWEKLRGAGPSHLDSRRCFNVTEVLVCWTLTLVAGPLFFFFFRATSAFYILSFFYRTRYFTCVLTNRYLSMLHAPVVKTSSLDRRDKLTFTVLFFQTRIAPPYTSMSVCTKNVLKILIDPRYLWGSDHACCTAACLTSDWCSLLSLRGDVDGAVR